MLEQGSSQKYVNTIPRSKYVMHLQTNSEDNGRKRAASVKVRLLKRKSCPNEEASMRRPLLSRVTAIPCLTAIVENMSRGRINSACKIDRDNAGLCL
jgi:hypothetical protein